MDLREAKREACKDMGRMALEVLETGMTTGFGFDDPRDGERYESAMGDLAHELLRRGGIDTEAPEVDERQLVLEVEIVGGEAVLNDGHPHVGGVPYTDEQMEHAVDTGSYL